MLDLLFGHGSNRDDWNVIGNTLMLLVDGCREGCGAQSDHQRFEILEHPTVLLGAGPVHSGINYLSTGACFLDFLPENYRLPPSPKNVIYSLPYLLPKKSPKNNFI